MEILAALEIKKMLVDRLVNLLSRGYVLPVVKYMAQCWQNTDTDISLIRYFVTEVLETIAPPYSQEFVSLFLPLVENEDDEREEDTQKSYYVEDSSFSMSMSNEKKDKYQSAVPVEVNVVVEPMKPIKIKLDSEPEPSLPDAPALAPTEIVVTAPTPRSGSPTDQEADDKEPLFTCTSDSESEGADMVSPAAQDEVKADWASFGDKTSEDAKKDSDASTDWANFGGQSESEDKPVAGNGWANFSDKPPQPIPQVSVTEPESEPEQIQSQNPSLSNQSQRRSRRL